MSIQIAHVNKRFGDFVALDDVSLTIPTGSLTALLGPSGGGKSTLLRIIAGLERADSGTVEIEGEEATHLPPQKRDVGFVFQHYAAFKHLSVYRNVAFGLEIRKRPKAEIRAKVDELLALVHLSQFGDRLPSQLSGGQRQRMALARALAVEPRVLLLDEPFGALDAKVRKELRDWLRRLHDEVHVTTVFVTHDQEEALEVADEIVVINEGRVEQVGTPDQLYDEPANPFVMSFLGPVTTLGGEQVRPHDLEVHDVDPGPGAVAGRVDRTVRVGFEVRLDVRVDDHLVQAVLTRADARSLDLAHGAAVWLRPTAQAQGVLAPTRDGRPSLPDRTVGPWASTPIEEVPMQVSILLQTKGSEVVTVGPETRTADVVAALSQHRIGAVVVSSDGRHIEGVVSERDIVRALAEHGADALARTARQLATDAVITCEPDTTVETLMATMTERRIRHVPVVVDGVLAGLVSIGDVVKDHISALETETQVLHAYIANP